MHDRTLKTVLIDVSDWHKIVPVREECLRIRTHEAKPLRILLRWPKRSSITTRTHLHWFIYGPRFLRILYVY